MEGDTEDQDPFKTYTELDHYSLECGKLFSYIHVL